jgi:CheY-like chemotaxis protein
MNTNLSSITSIKKPQHMFIVEDDVFIGNILVEKMEHADIQVDRFINAEDAISSLEKKIPDLILLDIFLPGMNGLDALEHIRKNEKTKDIFVIVLSNTDQVEDRERAQKLGALFVIKAATEPDKVLEFILDEYSKR